MSAHHVITSGTQLGRYTLTELISEHAPLNPNQFPVQLWRGRDEVLERSVSIRLVRSDDERIVAVLGAAQAAAMAEDRRLLRLLDVLSINATFEQPAYTAIISEWSTGKPLDQALQDREGVPFDPDISLEHVANIAWALNAALKVNLEHGRLRPSCVFITESQEIAVRGLAVDYALFGPLFDREANSESSRTESTKNDVDGLGSLLYCFTTGMWPYPVKSAHQPQPLGVPFTPKTGKHVPLPSSVRANIPRAIDDVVSRSVTSVQRQRGVTRIQDALGFANAIASARDYVAPVTTTTVRGPVMTEPTTPATYVKRAMGVLLAIAGVIALFNIGIALLGSPTTSSEDSTGVGAVSSEEAEILLTSPASPFNEVEVTDSQGTLAITSARSFDPLGGNPPQGATGTEKEKLAPLAIDADFVSGWTTKKYPTSTLGNKGGVGLIVDLGKSASVQGVSLGLQGFGTDLQVRVAEEILPDPDLWTKLVSIDNAGPQIDLRAPRPVTGRYVLIWLTGLPATETGDGYIGGINDLRVFGTTDTQN